MPPYKPEIDCPVSPAQYAEILAYAARWHKKTTFHPGIATSLDWIYGIAKNTGIGLHLLFNTYVSLEDCFLTPAFLPDLRITHSF